VKKILVVISISLVLIIALPQLAGAQCSICTKTAQQLGEKPAKGLNAGIIYLAFAPLAIGGYLSYRWWKSNKPV
jgi:hypothetical protein